MLSRVSLVKSGMVLGGLSLLLSCAAPAPEDGVVQEEPNTNGYDLYVDDAGNIARPTDFRTGSQWTHLGAWAVVNENGENNGLHDVFTTHDVAEEYRRTGEFKDGAVLVKEVRGLVGEALPTGRAHSATSEVVWFVMVKDREGRFEGNPLWGNGWGWALFNADNPAQQVATDFQQDCLGCHIPAQGSDWIYVYAYPTLGPRAQEHVPDRGDTGADD